MNEQGREQFERERQFLNDLVMKYSSKTTKRFFGLETQVFADGAIDQKTKEMLGLVASLVLRCDDCVEYHLIRCHECGTSDPEIEEAIAVALIVGGSVTIPHIRRAVSFWDKLNSNK